MRKNSWQNVTVERLSALIRIRRILDSILDLEAEYPHFPYFPKEISRCYPDTGNDYFLLHPSQFVTRSPFRN
jgi:hypothetical protein